MKRLLSQIGITYFSVLVAAFYLPQKIILIGAIGFAVSTAVLFFIKKTRKTVFIPMMALIALIACIVNLGYTALYVEPIIEKYGSDEHTVQAVLTDESYQSYAKRYYQLKTISVDGKKDEVKLLLKTSVILDAEPDDVLTFTANINAVENNYYRAKGYYLIADEYQPDVDITPAASHSWYYHAICLRRLFREEIGRALPGDNAALCQAVFIGDKYSLSFDSRRNFRYAGASYFIVVSGLHFAIITMLLYKLMQRCRIHRLIRLILILIIMLIYAAITGFQPSVVRSGIMMAFTLIGLTFRRQPYPLQHLGFVGLSVPFIFSPYSAGDIGLILSFYATMAILLWATPISEKLSIKDEFGYIPRLQIIHHVKNLAKHIIHIRTAKRREPTPPMTAKRLLVMVWNSFVPLLSVSLAANIAVVPISILVFREFSIVTALSAVLLYCEIYLILVLTFMFCLLFWIKPVAIILSWALYGLSKIVLWIVNTLGSFKWSHFRVTNEYIIIWLVTSLILFVVVMLFRNRYRYIKWTAIISVVLFMFGSIANGIIQSNVCRLEVYACRNGLCVGVNNGGDLHLLSMDADTKYLYPLWKRISYRYDRAHSAFCENYELLRGYQLYDKDEFAIYPIMLYDNSTDPLPNSDIVRFSDDSVFLLENDMTLSVSTHNEVAVPYLTVRDKTILIVPNGCTIGDIPVDHRTADIVIMSKSFKGMEQLCCNCLIVSNEKTPGDDIMHICTQRIMTTAEGDVTLNLR